MKTIIYLYPNNESQKILEDIKHSDYGDFTFHFCSRGTYLHIRFDGNFTMDFEETYLWIEDDDYCYFGIPQKLIRRFYVKGY